MSGTDATAPLRLLLVSDHRQASDALTSYLSRHGFEIVARVASPEEAAAAACWSHPDVALVDGELACGWRPVVDALESSLGRQRIAVVSAYWSRQEQQDADRSGIGATLLKRIASAALALQLRSLAA